MEVPLCALPEAGWRNIMLRYVSYGDRMSRDYYRVLGIERSATYYQLSCTNPGDTDEGAYQHMLDLFVDVVKARGR